MKRSVQSQSLRFITRTSLSSLLVSRSGTSGGRRLRHSSSVAEPRIASLLASGGDNSLHKSDTTPNNVLKVNGFVRSVRKQARVAFATIGDGSSLEPLQVVLTPEQAEGLSTGVGVSITGTWTPSPPGKQRAYELHAQDVRIMGEHDSATYPLQKKYHSPKFLRTLPHLRTRLPLNSLILRLRSQLIAHLTAHFNDRDFVQTHPPLITSSDCEGAGEVFTLNPASAQVPSSTTTDAASSFKPPDHFFNSPKYLTVSSQLHLEALAQSVGKVWALSPTFRAEKSDTPRHLSEFYMLEAEVTFTQDLNKIMDIVEDLMRSLTMQLKRSQIGTELLLARSADRKKDSKLNNNSPDQEISEEALKARWEALINEPWPRITYSKAVQTLQHASDKGLAQFKYSFESGLQSEHEKFLTSSGGLDGPVFVTDYPRKIKPFYMSPSQPESSATNEDSTVACFDLLLPEVCEVVGGSLREHRLSELTRSMEEHGLKNPVIPETTTADTKKPIDSDVPSEIENQLQWYLDLRKYGSVPHGGFGLGFDRFICYLSGVSNIRDTVTFPRWFKRSDC